MEIYLLYLRKYNIVDTTKKLVTLKNGLCGKVYKI